MSMAPIATDNAAAAVCTEPKATNSAVAPAGGCEALAAKQPSTVSSKASDAAKTRADVS